MKPSDILLSAMLHAGIVAGVMYGLSHYQNAPEVDAEIEPIFFEILEESVIAGASRPQPKASEPEPAKPTTIEPEVAPETEQGKGLPALENMVRSESKDHIQQEDGLEEIISEEDELPDVENMVRTEFSDMEKNESDVRQFDENKVERSENSEKVKEKEVCEVGENNKAENPYENMVQEQDRAEKADVQQAKVVSAPMALNRIVPVYPRSARRRGREGVVALEILVSGSGSVSKAYVVGSSGHSDLDAAALSAVNTARFAPATEDGVQVEGRLRLTFEFRLK